MQNLRAPEADALRVAAPQLEAVIRGIFSRLGLPDTDAGLCARALVTADLLGVDSHGVSNYIQILYVPGLRGGSINPRPEIRPLSETPTTALLDGDGGIGLVVGTRAMELAIRKAEESGIGVVTVRNSRHYGMAGHYALMALPHDMIGISLTNSDRFVLPTFGREVRVGTNPISVAVPADTEPPFLLDMATSTVPLGKILLARRVGATLPEGWAADREGRPTTDAEVAWDARRLLPLGGTYEQGSHKGYGLGVLVHILSGVLPGSGGGEDVELGSEVGHFFCAIKIDALRPAAEFKADMDRYLRSLRETPPAEGHDRVYYAGLIEHEVREERIRNGIPLHREVVSYLRDLAEELGVEERL